MKRWMVLCAVVLEFFSAGTSAAQVALSIMIEPATFGKEQAGAVVTFSTELKKPMDYAVWVLFPVGEAVSRFPANLWSAVQMTPPQGSNVGRHGVRFLGRLHRRNRQGESAVWRGAIWSFIMSGAGQTKVWVRFSIADIRILQEAAVPSFLIVASAGDVTGPVIGEELEIPLAEALGAPPVVAPFLPPRPMIPQPPRPDRQL